MSTGNPSKSERIDVRASTSVKLLLQEAARASHKNVSEFLLDAGVAAAAQALAGRRQFVIDEAQWQAFQEGHSRDTHLTRLGKLPESRKTPAFGAFTGHPSDAARHLATFTGHPPDAFTAHSRDTQLTRLGKLPESRKTPACCSEAERHRERTATGVSRKFSPGSSPEVQPESFPQSPSLGLCAFASRPVGNR